MVRITQVTPCIMVRDLVAALKFYIGVHGFT